MSLWRNPQDAGQQMLDHAFQQLGVPEEQWTAYTAALGALIVAGLTPEQIKAYAKEVTKRVKTLSEGWQDDGHPHVRYENGFCGTCGATANEYHYRCEKKEES